DLGFAGAVVPVATVAPAGRGTGAGTGASRGVGGVVAIQSLPSLGIGVRSRWRARDELDRVERGQSSGAILRNALLGASIGYLLRRGSPAAVAGFVVAIDVDTVDAVVRGRLASHIGEDRLEAVVPTLADPDATTAIVLVVSVVRIGTPLKHSCPRTIFWCPASLARLTMRERLRPANLDAETPARP